MIVPPDEMAVPGTLRLLRLTKTVIGRISLALLLCYLAFQTIHQWSNVVGTKLTQFADTSAERRYDDYVVFYAAGRLVAEGDGGTLYDLSTLAEAEHRALSRPAGGSLEDGVLPYFNPPFLAGALAPLTLLKLQGFAAVLFAIVCGLIAAAGYCMSRLLQLESAWQHAFFWSWYLSLGSVTFIALQSQTSPWPLLGWACFFFFQLSGNQGLAGRSFALALVKPQLAIVAVALLLWNRQWAALRGFVGIASILGIGSLMITGPKGLYEYPMLLVESTSWDHEKGIILENMYGWSGFFARLLGTGSSGIHSLATGVASVLTIGLLLWMCRRRLVLGDATILPVAGIMMCSSLLLSVHLYRQDLVIVALAVVCGASYSHRTTGTWGVWPLIAAGLWLAQFHGPRILFELGFNVQTPATVVVLACLAWTIRLNKTQRAGADVPTTTSNSNNLQAAAV